MLSSTINADIHLQLFMKETGFTEVALRTAAKVFAAAGLLALLFWLGWVMIDVEHMNSGFTLP